MERRAFIALSMTAFGVAVGGGVIGASYINAEVFLQTIIKNKLSYLKLDPLGLEAFVINFLSRRSLVLKLKSGFVSLTMNSGLDLSQIRKYIGNETYYELEEELTRTYLLSSDFFQNHCDESLVVKYLSFFDESMAGCRNPFAKLLV